MTGIRISGTSGVVLLDPPTTDRDPRRLAADIVAYSRLSDAGTASQEVSAKPFVVSGPGEYEIGAVFVIGVRLTGRRPERDDADLVTGYCISMESLTVCHLGALSQPPTQQQVEALGSVDVLMVPVSAGGALTPGQAVEVVNMIEPTLIVPLRYHADDPDDLAPVARFCQEMGVAAAEPLPALSVSRSKLPIERQVVILAPIGA